MNGTNLKVESLYRLYDSNFFDNKFSSNRILQIKTIIRIMKNVSRIQEKFIDTKPAEPRRTEVYIGWRINLYGPEVTREAARCGSGKIFNLLVDMVSKDQTSKVREKRKQRVVTTEKPANLIPGSKAPIQINCALTSNIDLYFYIFKSDNLEPDCTI